MTSKVGPLILQTPQPQGVGEEAGDKSAAASIEDSLDLLMAFPERSTPAHRLEEENTFT